MKMLSTSYVLCSVRLLKGRQYKLKTPPKKYNYWITLIGLLLNNPAQMSYTIDSRGKS